MISSQPPDRPLIGVGVIVMREGQVLLGKRNARHGAGTWQFPGGHLEWNEPIEDCARREVFEETGLRIDNLRRGPYTNDLFQEEGKHYVTLYVLADADGGEPILKEPDKCDRWGWFHWHDLPKPRFVPLANLLARGFDPFEEPHRVGEISPAETVMPAGSPVSDPPDPEIFEDLLKTDHLRIERIISKGHASPGGFWYDQAGHEWVMVLRGSAGISVEGVEGIIRLAAGDHLNLPARTRHRVEWTDPEGITLWLAVHY